MLLLQFGNMGRDLTLYNTELFAKQVKPQLAGPLRGRVGEPLVAEAAARARSARGRGRSRRERAARAQRAACCGEDVRVLEKGEGAPLGFLADLRRSRALDAVPRSPRRAAARGGAVAPGLPGRGGGFRRLDDLADWVTATLDLLEAAGLEGADLVGHGVGGLARRGGRGVLARVGARASCWSRRSGSSTSASRWPTSGRARASEVPALFSAQPDAYAQTLACPPAHDEVEWQIAQVRAMEAAARLLWPTRRSRPREAPPPHQRADAAALGRRGSRRPRQLRQALRRRHRRQDGDPLHPRRRPPRRPRRARRHRRRDPRASSFRTGTDLSV